MISHLRRAQPAFCAAWMFPALLAFYLSVENGVARAAEEAAGRPPNMVLIIADDMNWDDGGPYGHPTIHTPHLDQLAHEGLRFERAFVTASSCSPSRASMLTGRYPHNTDAEQLHWPVPAEQVTFVEQLKAAGYWTAAAGKWHLGPHMKDRFNLVKEADESGFQLPAGTAAHEAVMQAEGEGASGCEDWLPVLQARPKDKPFFLWLAALDPHRDYTPGAFQPPHQPSQVRVPPTMPDTADVRRDLALYYDEIARLDRFVGDVLKELDRQGVADETLVIFISDNGRPFPRDKTTLYDGGIKTPMLVRWPGHVKPGGVSPSLVSTVDLAPTFLAAAGVKIDPQFAGKSLLPVLRDPQVKVRDYIFAEDHWHDFEDHARAVRSERYKLIRNDYTDLANTPPADVCRSLSFQAMRRLHAAGELTPAQQACFTAPRPNEELYDLARDPYELRNVAADPSHAEILTAHRAALDAWAERTGDRVPAYRTPDEFDRESGAPLPARIRPRPSKQAMKAARQAKTLAP